MGRKVTAVYAVFSVLAFVFLASWFAYTFFRTKADNLINAASTFQAVKNSISVSIENHGSFEAPGFRSFVHSLFLEDPTIDTLSITGSGGQVQYIFARHASQLRSPQATDGRWSGSIEYNRITQHLFSAPLPSPRNSPLRVQSVFTVLSHSDLYSIARILLISLISFVILTGIVIVIVPMFDRRREVQRSEETGQASPETSGVPPAAEGAAARAREVSVGRHRRQSAQAPGVEAVAAEGPEVQVSTESDDHVMQDNAAAEAEPATETPQVLPTNEHPDDEPASEAPAGGQSPSEDRDTPERIAQQHHPEGATLRTEEEHGLPPDIELPSLQQVLGEDPTEIESINEILMYNEQRPDAGGAEGSRDESAAAGRSTVEVVDEVQPIEDTSTNPQLEVTEVDEPAATPPAADSASGYRSAADELEDIGDFEDLEEIDGYRSPDIPEQTAPKPRPHDAQPEPAMPSLGLDIDEPEELLPASEPESDDANEDTSSSASRTEDLEVPEPIELETEEIELDLGELEAATDELPPDRLESELEGSIEIEETAPEEQDKIASGASIEPVLEEIELDAETTLLEPSAAEGEVEPTEVEELEPIGPDDNWSSGVSGGFESQEAPPKRSEGNEIPPDLPPIQEPDSFGVQEPGADEETDTSKHTRELFNPETGLAWRDHLEQRLSFELDRAASFDQDLSLCVVRFVKPADNVARINYAREIRSYFPFHDLCFEYGEDAFAIVLPNMDIDQAIRSMENFNDKMNDERPGWPKVLFGLSARNGRLLGGDRLLSEADTALQKARDDGKNIIFALRVDPGKYREFIKSTLK